MPQRRIEAVAGMGEVGRRGRRPQPGVDADEQQLQSRSDEVGHRGVAKRLQLGSRETHDRRVGAGDRDWSAWPHPYWPLFDLVVTTPRLTLRYIDDALGVELATLAAAGIHDPAWMPFAHAVDGRTLARARAQRVAFYWRHTGRHVVPSRGTSSSRRSSRGTVVGTTNLIADGFPVERTFETGSWLGRPHQGRGLGTEMRVATLHLGFLALDALDGDDRRLRRQPASLGVTRKLGYEPNGVEAHDRRGALAEIHRFRMTRDSTSSITFAATTSRSPATRRCASCSGSNASAP